MIVNGFLNINKPPQRLSTEIVSLVKRLSGVRKVGHAGTLDPLATGVLPICLGHATRLTEFLIDTNKTYLAQIELGAATDTYDAEGTITCRGDSSNIDREQLKTVLASFSGTIKQYPPMYSAARHQGKRLYHLARQGIQVQRKAKTVDIYRLDIVQWQPPLVTIEIDCGKGTYIRSLAHDLGQVLGCGAYLKSLVRLRLGIFDIQKAVTIPQLEEAFHLGHWQSFLYPIDAVLFSLKAITVDQVGEQAIINGRPWASDSIVAALPGEHCRAYSSDGRFLAVLRSKEDGLWQPEKVFPSR